MGKSSTRALIVAMKGHPATGKSTLARAIASALGCPLLDKDDIRGCTLPLATTATATATSTNNNNDLLLNSFSYDVVWKLASTQLQLGLSVVLDSPLSRESHLRRLVDLASSSGAHLVIVECRPSDEGEWRRRLEKRGEVEGGDGGPSWHKPATWRDLEMLVEGYGGCTEYDTGGVPRLVLDTTATACSQEEGVEELLSCVMRFIAEQCGSDH